MENFAAAHKMLSVSDIKKYIFGGNSTFTVQNVETGNRFTFKVKTPKGEKSGDVFFVSVLSGPNNQENYSYMGIVNKEKSRFIRTKNSRVGEDAPSYKGFNWLFGQVATGKELPQKVEFLHSGRCGRCGRLLTTPESIKAGFGPECIHKIF